MIKPAHIAIAGIAIERGRKVCAPTGDVRKVCEMSAPIDPTTSPTERLERASQLVQSVLGLLDPGTRTCADCGHTRYDRWNEKQAIDQLQGAVGRLRRATELLDSAPTRGQEGSS